MASVNYSAGIIITDQKKEGNQIAQISTRALRKEFQDATKAALDKIKSLATGARLLQSIDQSNHQVKIYRTWRPDGGNSQGGSTNAEMVKGLQDVVDGATVLSHILSAAAQDMSKRSALKKFFNVGKAKPFFMKRDGIAKLVGVKLADLELMEKGRMPIPANVDAKLRSYLYAFLYPGDGCDCYVLFNHTRDNLSPEHKKYLPQSHVWTHRPPTVALGHELIHAWRAMTGMVLFDYGWEEEAMTVGLPPFSFMEYTENRLRIEYGDLAIRPDYQNIRTKTPLTDGQKLGVDRTNMAWTGNQNALISHKEPGVVNAMASRRAAMGYGNDDDDGADDWD